ncbi:hypothetical protein RM190_21145 [Paracoccus sp. CPCC 101403]|uniref:Uncharacterized protein n=1 Tax=Paracoccus broussonetiae TaxID=3075834 RepID=A0ABU3EJF2_9RHOB|nr:hypothetical protein [Paracoccus sp. CPCC 101403]MDT1064381.1 hypothetical protein [Paracoccus sp. CPCC 101403]
MEKNQQTLIVTLKPHPLTRDTKGKPKWDAVIDSKIIVAGSTNPTREAATKLLLEMGVAPDQVIAFQHENIDYYLFTPTELLKFAKQSTESAIKRIEANSTSLKRHAQGPQRRIKGFRLPNYYNNGKRVVAALYDALERINQYRVVAQ